jgi:hypothetical protein
VTGRSFFPRLIAGPFETGLHEAFTFAIVACLIAAAASLMRGGKYHHAEAPPSPSGDGLQVHRNGASANPTGATPLARTATAEERHAS